MLRDAYTPTVIPLLVTGFQLSAGVTLVVSWAPAACRGVTLEGAARGCRIFSRRRGAL